MRTDRLWALGGVLACIVLLAVGWFFLISPQNAETSRLKDETAAARQRVVALERRLAELRRQNDELPRYRAKLAQDRQALPTTSGMSDFLRELQVAGDATGVTVGGLTVGAPTQVKIAGGQLFALPVTVLAEGTAVKLGGFLDHLQRVQPRAVLIISANAVSAGQGGTFAGVVSLTINMQVFVAPSGAGEPAPTQSPAPQSPAPQSPAPQPPAPQSPARQTPASPAADPD